VRDRRETHTITFVRSLADLARATFSHQPYDLSRRVVVVSNIVIRLLSMSYGACGPTMSDRQCRSFRYEMSMSCRILANKDQ
jgi:hypothetical protein